MKMTLNIEPKPQTRPRFSKFGTYEDPKMKAWRRQCSQLIEQRADFSRCHLLREGTFERIKKAHAKG